MALARARVTDQERSLTIVAGVSQSGKSVFTRRYLLNGRLAYRFIFDDQQGSESYAERLNRDSAGDEFELGLQLCTGWVIFNPHMRFPGQLPEALTWFCDWTHTKIPRLPGRKALVIDEAYKHVNPNRYPLSIGKCVQSSAGYGLECFFGTQTPHKLPEAIQSHCTEVVCFKLGMGGDKSLEWAKARGFNPEEIQALPKLSYVARNLDSGGELRGRIEL